MPATDMQQPRRGYANHAFRSAGFCAAAILTIQACGKDTVSPPPATVSGTVALLDAWANRADDFSGVDVSIDGLPIHTVTDASGAWMIDNVPTGTHSIVFSKQSFGTMLVPAQGVAAPAVTIPLVTLAQAPWQQAVIDSIRVVSQSDRDTYVVDGHLSAPPPANAKIGGTIAFFGSSNTVSTDLDSFAVWASAFDPTGKATTFSISLPAATAVSAFGHGAHIFVTAYASSAICGCYTDPRTKRPVVTTAGPRANVVSLTIP